MGETYTMKQNDTSPSLIVEIKTPGVSLAGANAVLIMKSPAGALKINRRTLAIIKDEWDLVGGPEVLIDWATDGSDTNENGDHPFEIEVEYSDGLIETFPNSDYHTLKIVDDLG